MLDEDSDRSLSRVTLYLTIDEARELRSTLDAVVQDRSRHEHISSNDYEKQITVCVYDTSTLQGFSERSRRLILEDS
jgi:hypothetical protein